LLATALWRNSSWRAILACTLVFVGLAASGANLPNAGDEFWRWHAPVLAILATAAIFKDELAVRLRQFAWPLVPAIAVVAAVLYPLVEPDLSEAALAGLLAALLLCSLGYWQRQPQSRLLAAASVTLAANLAMPIRRGYAAAEQSALREGMPWLTGGLLVVAIALAISLAKMGLWQSVRVWLERCNARLRTWSGNEA
jgi:hypothetical protein